MKLFRLKVLALDASFEGGRMFVGATSVTYMLSQGIGLQQIALLKSVQAITLFCGELPTGIIADRFGRKVSLTGGMLVSTLGFLAYFFGSSFTTFALGEFCTAIGLCFWSGAYEAYAIEQGKLLEEPGAMDHFFHLNHTVNQISVMICGALGGWIGAQGLNFPYLAASTIFFLGSIALFLSQPETETIARLNTKSSAIAQLKSIQTCILKDPDLRLWIFALIAVQFAVQPILHYWQPLLIETDALISPAKLGLIFSAYCASSAVFSLIYAKLSRRYPSVRSPLASGLLFILSGIFYLLAGTSKSISFCVLSLLLLQGFLSLARTSLSVRINEKIPNQNRATLLSSVTLISRAGMILALWSIGASSKISTNTHILFQWFAVASLIMTILFAGISAYKRPLAQRIREQAAPVMLLFSILSIQCWTSIASQSFYPFSPYRMFSKNWKDGILMDEVQYRDEQNRTYRTWQALDVPFFQANHLSFVTFLDPSAPEQKNALCKRAFASLSHANRLDVLGIQMRYSRSQNGEMKQTAERQEVVHVCRR